MAHDPALSVPRTESGQAAVEFVFALVFLIAMAAVLFQALQFELDVFNKTWTTRYDLFEAAREDEPDNRPRMISEPIEGKRLGDLTPFSVPFQATDLEARYGPKQVYVQCGTKYFFPGGDTAETIYDLALVGLLVADHLEQSSGNVEQVFSAVSGLTGALASACNAMP